MLKRPIVAIGLAAVLAAVLAGPAAAGTGFTYHGRIVDATFSCDGAPVASPYSSVGGTWNLNVSGSTAVVTIDVFYDGHHHLSFGMPGGSVVSATPDAATATFGTATATVADEAFTWSTPVGACTSEHPYDSLTYMGTVGRQVG